jgi:hypothetical protein
MRAIAEEASALVRKYKGAYSGEHGDGLCRGEWIKWQFGPKINDAFGEIKRCSTRSTCCARTASSNPPRMDDTRLMRFPPSYKVIPLQPRWTGAPGTCRTTRHRATTAPGTGGDPAQGFAKAVEMCNNNGHCRKFDAGTMCPSYRVTRDEKHLTRGRANTLRLALSRPARPGRPGQRGGARGAGPVRELQGLQARLPHRRRHGAHEGRVPAPLQEERLVAEGPADRPPARLRARQPLRAAAEPAQQGAGWPPGRKAAGPLGARSLPQWQRRALLQPRAPQAHPHRQREEVLAATRPVVLFVDTFNGFFESENAQAALKVLQAAGYTVHVAAKDQGRRQAPVLRPHLPGQRHGRQSQGQGARGGGRAAALRRARASPSWAWSPPAC